jgi:hypothetical protein
MYVSLPEIDKKIVTVNKYMNSLDQVSRGKFLTRKHTYVLNRGALKTLKKVARKYTIVVFSAEWRKDCVTNIPVLALISEATGLKVKVFGGLKKDPLSHAQKWRIPPSPPEAQAFDVDDSSNRRG